MCTWGLIIVLRCPYVRHHLKTLVNASKGLVKTDLAVADMTLTDEDTQQQLVMSTGKFQAIWQWPNIQPMQADGLCNLCKNIARGTTDPGVDTILKIPLVANGCNSWKFSRMDKSSYSVNPWVRFALINNKNLLAARSWDVVLCFGASDTQLCVCSEVMLKMLIRLEQVSCIEKYSQLLYWIYIYVWHK